MPTDNVRDAYDRVAGAYADKFTGELAGKPLDRAWLLAFAEQVRGPALDVGCGPGHVTRHLRGLGVDAGGLDLSPAMIDLARAADPDGRYEVGDLCALGERGLSGISAMYALVNLAPSELGRAAASLAGALAPGGLLLVGGHADHDGPARVHLEEWLGAAVDVDFYFHPLPALSAALAGAGLTIEAELLRRPYPAEYPSRRAYVLARRT